MDEVDLAKIIYVYARQHRPIGDLLKISKSVRRLLARYEIGSNNDLLILSPDGVTVGDISTVTDILDKPGYWATIFRLNTCL